MKTKPFFKYFVYPINQSKATTFAVIIKTHINKALKFFFINHNIYKLKDNQIFGINFKLRFDDANDDDPIRSMSTIIRADKTSFTKLTTLFKVILSRRINDYKGNKAKEIIFTSQRLSEDYTDTRLTDEMKKEIISNKQIIEIELKSKFSIMSHKNQFKLPLNFAGNVDFLNGILTLNPDISNLDNDSFKYKIIFIKTENNLLEVEVKIVFQKK